jgi:protein-tyrosine kinase
MRRKQAKGDEVNEQSRNIASDQVSEPGQNIATYSPDDLWRALPAVDLSHTHLARHRVIAARRKDPAHVAIDMLRTRLLQALNERGWHRVAITSPTAGCGKTFVASNLAISMARGESRRVVLMDMDLRNPGLAQVFGVGNAPKIREYLSGYLLAEEYFQRVGHNLALGLNAAIEPSAAEFILESMTSEVLSEMQEVMAPDVILYDLPPTLTHDDVVAFLPQVDGVLLVLGGGITTTEEVRTVERLLGDTPLIGAILNKAEG